MILTELGLGIGDCMENLANFILQYTNGKVSYLDVGCNYEFMNG